MQPELAPKYQTMLTLWAAMLMSVFLYFLVTLFAAPEISRDAHQRGGLLILTLTALGALLVIISFPVKHKVLKQSVEKQDIGLVQKAMIIAIAICEASALLGLVECFVVGGREYYLLFVFAAAGMMLHFPRRSQLEAAQWSPLGSSTQPQYGKQDN
jgi:NADH:ubiquinone oxidoreductase subunit 2 (subunit N)